jgi:hypothetical protein
MNDNGKKFDQQNQIIRKQILSLSFETYKIVNSIFYKIFIFSLPLIIIFTLYPLMFLDTELPYYELARIEKSIGLSIGLFFMPIVAIFVHRKILLNEEKFASWYFLLSFFKGRYWKFILNTFLFLFIYWVGLMFFLIIGKSNNYNFFFYIFIIGLILILYLQARLSLCFPIIATNQKGWIIKSFKLTQNLGFNLPVAFFSILLPIVFTQTFLAVIIKQHNISFDLLPLLLIGFIEILLRIYMISLMAVFFSKVYMIVTNSNNIKE